MDENWITGAKTVVYLLLLGLIIAIITFFITGVGLLVSEHQPLSIMCAIAHEKHLTKQAVLGILIAGRR